MTATGQHFKDLFSRQSAVYRQARPGYPDSLFRWLASLVPKDATLWDCATGNGQAAVSLAQYFPHIIATDASEEQIRNAVAHNRISYRVAPAEHSGLPDSSVDLITVATAAHWFNHDAFYQEVHRVLKPGGVLALWTYHSTTIAPDIDAVVARYETGILDGYWAKEIRHVANRYTTLPFPFPLIDTPVLQSQVLWTLEQLAGFFMSWSATQHYIALNRSNPLDLIMPALQSVWGDPSQKRDVAWNLAIKAGRKLP